MKRRYIVQLEVDSLVDAKRTAKEVGWAIGYTISDKEYNGTALRSVCKIKVFTKQAKNRQKYAKRNKMCETLAYVGKK